MQRADEGVPLVEPQQDVHAPLQLRVPHVKSRHAEKVRWVSVTLANIFFHFHKKLVVDVESNPGPFEIESCTLTYMAWKRSYIE